MRTPINESFVNLTLGTDGDVHLSDCEPATWPSPIPHPQITAHDRWVSANSAPTTSLETILTSHLRTLYPSPTYTLTTTRSPEIDLQAFAASRDSGLKLLPAEADGELALDTRLRYLRPARRADGPGGVGREALWAVWDAEWIGERLKIYMAEWAEGYSFIKQYWFASVGKNAETPARTLVLAAGAAATALGKEIFVFDGGFWRKDADLWKSVQKSDWKDVILKDDFKAAIRQDVEGFFKSEQVYKDLEVPWKRGVIFLGPPGNGKTISLKALIKSTGQPALYVKSFRSYGGDERGIRDIFVQARAVAPCLLIIEDLDSAITEQNRSFFLNEVDGLEDNKGLFIIGTTNHPEKLDASITSRPSRFDRRYTFPDPDFEERKAYALYWKDKLSSNKHISFPDALVENVARSTDGFSFAFLKEAFVSTLLLLAADKDKEPAGRGFASVLKEQIKSLRKQIDEGGKE